MKSNSILLAHNASKVIDGMRQTILSNNNESLVKSFNHGLDVLTYIIHYQPEIAFIDINLFRLDGISIAKSLASFDNKTKVVLIVDPLNQSLLRTALEYKVLGFSTLRSKEQILECLEAVSDNEYYIDTVFHYSQYYTESV